MRGRSILILAILVAALAAFAWFVDRDRPGSEERRQRADRVLALQSDEITTVRIDSGEDRVILERRAVAAEVADGETAGDRQPADAAADAEWWLLEPVEARADDGKVEGLLSALEGLDRQRRLQEAEPAQYGLDEPSWRLSLERGERSTTIAVGDELAGLDSVALRVDGGDIELVPSAWLGRLQPEGTGWRSPELFDHARDDIRQVRIESGNGSVSLERGEAGFRIVEPIDDLADRSLVDSLLTAIVNLEAEEYVDTVPDEGPTETSAASSISEPTRITTALADGSEWTLRLGVGGEALAGGEGVRIDESALDEAAARSPENWRSRALSPFDGYDVEAAVFIDSEGETNLARVDGDWQRDGEPIGFSAATGPLYALADAEAEEFQPMDAVAGLPSILAATLTSSETNRELNLFERADGEGCLGSIDDRDVVLALPASTCDKVKDDVASMREAEPIGSPSVDEAADGTVEQDAAASDDAESTDDTDSTETAQ